MQTIRTIQAMKDFARRTKAGAKTLALVPTMGALHDGHLSLARHARERSDRLVVSIFVNPAQFGPHEDWARYPRNLDRDFELLLSHGVTAVFVPQTDELYSRDFSTFVDPGPLAQSFEGVARPGHFRGVATIVLKLFHIVMPHVAIFGQKDFQQALLIRRTVADLDLDVRLEFCPIVREPDGLAVSSRNDSLKAEDRAAAPALYRALRTAQAEFWRGVTRATTIITAMQKVLEEEPRLRMDYAALVEPCGLKRVEEAREKTVALVAGSIGGTRLIDNLIFGPPGASEEALLAHVWEDEATETS